MRKFAENFYKSIQWQNCRNSYMKQVGYLCEDCFEKGLITPAEEVHHVIELSSSNINDANITLDFSNLKALCRVCHRARHKQIEKRYEVDELGRVTPL